MSLILRLAPALIAAGLTLGSSAGHSAAGCLQQASTPALPEIALGELSPPEYKLLAAEDCTRDCVSDAALAVLSPDMPAPSHLPVVAGAEDVAAWHTEIFEHVSRTREHDDTEYYCKL